MKENNQKRINCFDCIHLQITWQPATPYACKAIGFKSKIIPSMEVFKNSGSQCMHSAISAKYVSIVCIPFSCSVEDVLTS